MVYSEKKLQEYCAQALCLMGLGKTDAQTVAQVLLSADKRGVHSHGCVRMEGYVDCLRTKGVKGDARWETVSEGPAYALLNANQGLGIPVSVAATELAIEKAAETGIAIVNVYNSHHHGACGYYTMMCANAGMIGLAMSTGDTIMAVTGSASRSIGNNPFSYAVPAGKYGAVCYDIAMSTVAAGKISIAAEEDRQIPLGWLLDCLGNPTTEPKDYDRGGALVPFGGYKGYGLSMMVESLAGILSGAALLEDIHAWNKNPDQGGNVGHCFIAIDPKRINPGFDLPGRAEEMLEKLTGSPKAPGVERIYFPGQIEQEKEAAANAEGIPLPQATENALARVAALTGLAFEKETMQM